MCIVYPTLLQSANNVNSHSWFNIKKRKNNGIKNEYINTEHNYKYTHTKKIILNLTDLQKETIKLWMNDCIDMYNIINEYIKEKVKIIYHVDICGIIKKSSFPEFKKVVNFYNLRKEFINKKHLICNRNNLPVHQCDYAIKHCVEMYKSAHTNFTNKNIKHFNISNLDKNKRRKNMVIEPSNVSKTKNTIFSSIFKKEIKSNLPLNIIERNSILQLDTLTDKFIIITPYNVEYEVKLEQNEKCGIDPGCRTFLTVYSPEKTYEICTDSYKIIDKYHKKLDKLKASIDNKLITQKKYNLSREEYQNKLNNYVNDLHGKAARFILERFKTVNIGKLSTKSAVSNLTSNLQKITKRRLLTLSHYRFRMKLEQMSIKWNNKIIIIDEYLTSKTCCKCKNIKYNLGDNKIYDCSNCNLIIDRDINASINIYNDINKI